MNRTSNYNNGGGGGGGTSGHQQRYQPKIIQKTHTYERGYQKLQNQYQMIQEDGPKLLGSKLPELTLENSLSKISFCDKECYNVNNSQTKESILKYVESKYKGLNIIDKQYVILSPQMVKNITNHEHIISTFTNGNPYLLYLTRIDNVACSIFIDRKLKEGYSYPKIHCVQYKFDSTLFDNDTIFTGELVRDANRNWQYIISDLVVYNGEIMKTRNVLSRFNQIHTILDTLYTPDVTTDICPIYVKRIFQYVDINYVLNQFIPSLPYTCKGLIFYTLNSQFSDYAWIIPKDKQINVLRKHDIDTEFYKRYPEYVKYQDIEKNQIQYMLPEAFAENTSSANKKHACVGINELYQSAQISALGKSPHYLALDTPIYLLAMKTEIPDIYNLYVAELEKIGIAFIPNMKVSKILTNAFANDKKDLTKLTIPVKCTWHKVFKRWVPYDVDVNGHHHIITHNEYTKKAAEFGNIPTGITSDITTIGFNDN